MKGDPRAGRPKGAKDKVPRSFKRNVEALFREVHSEHPDLLVSAIVRGMKATPAVSFRFVEMWLNFQHGKPTQTVNIGPDLSGLSAEELKAWDRLLEKAHGHARGADAR